VRIGEKAYYLLVVLIFSILLARFLPIPFGVFTVISGSMEPSIRILDIAIVFGREYSVGDVIAWCTTPWHCVMHRVVDITEDSVMTKGDVNPVPDPPIPRSLVKGKVIFIVARELWLPVFLGLLTYILYDYRKIIPPKLALNMLAIVTYVILLAVAISLITPQTWLYIPLPELYLSRYYVVEKGVDCLVIMGFNALNIGIEEVLSLKVFNESVKPYSYNSTIVEFVVPEHLMLYAVSEGRKLYVSLEAKLTRMGYLKGSYQIVVTPVKPRVYVENKSLVIENPSCYPIAFNITWMILKPEGEWEYVSEIIVIKRGSTTLNPPFQEVAAYVYVDVRYRFMGSNHIERLEVR